VKIANVEGQATCYVLNCLLSLYLLETWPICGNVILSIVTRYFTHFPDWLPLWPTQMHTSMLEKNRS